MSTTSTGRAAEQVAAAYLTGEGYTILDRNWRNRWCEVDLVARRAGAVHIIEVKYRASTAFGAPMEYVRHDKLARLARAALAWTQAQAYRGPYQVDVVSITGPLAHPQLEIISDVTSSGAGWPTHL